MTASGGVDATDHQAGGDRQGEHEIACGNVEHPAVPHNPFCRHVGNVADHVSMEGVEVEKRVTQKSYWGRNHLTGVTRERPVRLVIEVFLTRLRFASDRRHRWSTSPT